MLALHFSNRTEALAERLLQRLDGQRADPFAADQLIVPSAAMRRWLTLAIAQRQGICANVRFDFLAQWLWTQIGRVLPEARAESPFAPDVLVWRVHAALSDTAWLQDQPRLAAYLRQSDEVMRYELAERVAALVEQMVTYRPDWLQQWQSGHDTGLAHDGEAGRTDEAWQAELWRRLAGELGLAPRHPIQAFAEVLQRGGAALARRCGLPPQVHVFAPPAIPPLHQRLLQQLGQVIDIDVYVLNPCREYWFELIDRRRLSHLAASGRDQGHEEGHPLLAAWAGRRRALVDGLVDLGGDDIADDSHFVPAPGRSLLSQLQNSLLDLQPLQPGSITLDDDDRSLELHVCHSPTRELEALHDRLLSLFAADPGLQPGDVLVVTPQLEAWAPLIDAVFGTVPAERRLPYAVTGRARSSVNAPARALLSLLSLLGSRMPVSAVFGLLQQPVVARRFGLDDDALQQVHGWLQDAGAHWGLDGAHRAGFGVPGDERHTLSDAFSRLFLGHALADVDGAATSSVPMPLAGLLPAGNAEGRNALLLGRCWRFVQALQQLHADVARPRRPADWARLLLDATETFIDARGDDEPDLRDLQDALRALAAEQQRAGVDAPLPLAVQQVALQHLLDDPARGGVPTGSITFSALSSLRNLPYRVVCVLGLDDGVFPSPPRTPEFDLMAAHPRRGDRQRRDDERNLFLDLLLAARDMLHLSHTGRSVRDNALLPPSVLVAELLDLLLPAIAPAPGDAAALRQARRRLVVEHPLQPFSIDAFSPQADPRVRSHDRELADALRRSLAAEPVLAPADIDFNEDDGSDDEDEREPDDSRTLAPFFTATLPEPDPEWQQVSLDQLIEFFRNPCRYLLRRRLRLDLPQDDDELQDDEPFLADRRAQQALAQRLLPACLAGDAEPQALRAAAEAAIDWPAGNLGRQQLDGELQALAGFAERVRNARQGASLPPQAISLTFDLDGRTWTLNGSLPDLHPGGQLRWRYGGLQASDRLQAWILHLALCGSAPPGVPLRTTWLAQGEQLVLGPVAQAPDHLQALLRLYAQGLREPLHFFPRSAWTWVDSEGHEGRTRDAWLPRRDGWAEGSDRAYRLALRGLRDALDDSFRALAHQVFDPLRAHIEGGAP